MVAALFRRADRNKEDRKKSESYRSGGRGTGSDFPQIQGSQQIIQKPNGGSFSGPVFSVPLFSVSIQGGLGGAGRVGGFVSEG